MNHASANAEGDGKEDGEQGGGGEGSNESGDGDGHGRGEGEGEGGTGARGGSRASRSVPVRAVRVLSPSDPRELDLSFECSESGVAQIRIDEAGDTSAIRHKDLAVLDENREPIDLQRVEVRAGRRLRIRVRSTEPIDDRAWRVAMTIREEGGREGVRPR